MLFAGRSGSRGDLRPARQTGQFQSPDFQLNPESARLRGAQSAKAFFIRRGVFDRLLMIRKELPAHNSWGIPAWIIRAEKSLTMSAMPCNQKHGVGSRVTFNTLPTFGTSPSTLHSIRLRYTGGQRCNCYLASRATRQSDCGQHQNSKCKQATHTPNKCIIGKNYLLTDINGPIGKWFLPGVPVPAATLGPLAKPVNSNPHPRRAACPRLVPSRCGPPAGARGRGGLGGKRGVLGQIPGL